MCYDNEVGRHIVSVVTRSLLPTEELLLLQDLVKVSNGGGLFMAELCTSEIAVS